MTDDDTDPWETVGRRALASDIETTRMDVNDALDSLAEAVRDGHDITPEDIVEARIALNAARRTVEDFVAPVTPSAREWGSPPPSIPRGRVDEYYGTGGENDE